MEEVNKKARLVNEVFKLQITLRGKCRATFSVYSFIIWRLAAFSHTLFRQYRKLGCVTMRTKLYISC